MIRPRCAQDELLDGLLRVERLRRRIDAADYSLINEVDGSAHLEGELTAGLTERLLFVLDVLAAPQPAADGTPDPRSAVMRNHHGLFTMTDLVARSELMPSVNGIAGTFVVTMTSEHWVPPKSIDPTQTSVRNRLHDVARVA